MEKGFWQKIKQFFRSSLGLTTKSNTTVEKKGYLDSFKQLDVDIACNNRQQKIFDMANVGDILYCKMPLPIEELEKIDNDHRRRPYYIAYKLNNGFIAYQSSSKASKYLTSINEYAIKNKEYLDSHVITYINLNQSYYLPKSNISSYMFSVDEDDFNQINRRLYILSKNNYIELYKSKPLIFTPTIGDVVYYNNANWLIINSNEKKYSVIYLKEGLLNTTGRKMILNYDSKSFTLDLDNKQHIKKGSKLTTKAILDDKSIEEVCKAIKEKKLNWNNLMTGEIFLYEGCTYYCFNKNEYNAICYKAYIDEMVDKNSVINIRDNKREIAIDLSKQYTINKSANYEVLVTLNSKNIALINKSFNNLYTRGEYFTEYNIGTILNINNKCEYVYLYSNNKHYYAVKVYEYLHPEYYENYGVYKLNKEKVITNGEVSDDDLLQILADQLYEKNDKCYILLNKYKQLKETSNHE